MFRAVSRYPVFLSLPIVFGVCVATVSAATDIGIDLSSLPMATPDSTIVINLVSNQQKTTFAIDGKVVGVAQRMYVRVPNRPLTITAKPEVCMEKEDYIQPPYRDYTQIGFYFLKDDCETSPSARRGALPTKEQLDAITDTAAKICQTAPLRSSNQRLSLDSKGKAELNGLIKKLADLGISGAVQYESGSSNGVLQNQLAGAIADGNRCKLDVFNRLVDALLK